MTDGFCFKKETCSLFSKNLLRRKQSEEVYKSLYCNTKDNWKQCKRYLVSKKLGSCPDFVMPNSNYSVEEIIEKYNKGFIE